jgi:hypothetical protein
VEMLVKIRPGTYTRHQAECIYATNNDNNNNNYTESKGILFRLLGRAPLTYCLLGREGILCWRYKCKRIFFFFFLRNQKSYFCYLRCYLFYFFFIFYFKLWHGYYFYLPPRHNWSENGKGKGFFFFVFYFTDSKSNLVVQYNVITKKKRNGRVVRPCLCGSRAI